MQKKVSFKSNKGYLLRGVLHIPKGKGPFPTVIVQHGFSGNHNSPIIKKISDNLEKNRFIVLRFTLSGHKPSGGTYKDVLASQFIKDIEKALDFLIKNPKVNKNRIGMAGHSMGSFASLVSANVFNKQIRSVVSISSLYNVGALLKSFYRDKKVEESNKDYWKIGGFKVTTKHFNDRSYLQKKFLISDIHCPVLIIHGNQDRRVQLKDAYTIYSLLGDPKELKIIKGADHGFKSERYSKQVVSSTLKWFNKYLAFKESKVVNTFLECNGKVLLLKRGDRVGTHQGYWCSVGGYLDGNDILKQSKQEVCEELGIPKKQLRSCKRGKAFKIKEDDIDRIWHVHPVLIKLKRKPKVKLDWENTEKKRVPMLDKVLKNLGLVTD